VKIQIPNELKKDVPDTKFGKLLMATPVVMTVIATLLAGLASSEMTRAQYDRAMGAQLQSKAGDQWGYFQAKKLRSAMQRSSMDLLQGLGDIQPVAPAQWPDAATASIQAALVRGVLPGIDSPPPAAPEIQKALEALEAQRPEAEVLPLVAAVMDADLAKALAAARLQATALDAVTKPITDGIDAVESALVKGGGVRSRDFAYARIRFNATRYDLEARYNQAVANLLEMQVRKANLSAERHHRRSGKFFFGMLGAQAAVIVSTFAVAAQKRNFLWSLAAAAGLFAILFAIYVYLKV
jgi:hypothetical protein